MVAKSIKKAFGIKSKKSKKKGSSAVPVDETAVAAEETAPVETEPEPSAPAEEEARDSPAAEEEAPAAEGETPAVEADDEPALDKEDAPEEAEVDKDATADETVGVESTEDSVKYSRIDTLHADITVPKTAQSGDILDVEHDGAKQIRVPSGVKGQDITVKMVSSPVAQETGPFCGCGM